MTTLFDHIINPPIAEIVLTEGEIDVRFVAHGRPISVT